MGYHCDVETTFYIHWAESNSNKIYVLHENIEWVIKLDKSFLFIKQIFNRHPELNI
jgi:hypothetical protein